MEEVVEEVVEVEEEDLCLTSSAVWTWKPTRTVVRSIIVDS